MITPTGGGHRTHGCELLDWDSEFFGLRIARLRADRLDDAAADAALAWCGERGVDCLYFLASGGDRQTLHAVEARSFDLVDVRVDLRHQLAGNTALTAGVRHARGGDQAALAAIAREAFTATRFFFDPRFPRDRCAALYETWIARGLAGELAEVVLVVELDDAPVGFVTCELDDAGVGRIGLLGVSAPARGRGIGEQLCQGALDWFRERRATSATVTTQGRSVAALRLYERCGFTTSSISLWYHRWFNDEER